MKLALALLLLACGGSDKPAPPVSNQVPVKSDDERVREAELRADEAAKRAQEVEEKLDKLQHDLAELGRRLDAAVDQVVAAQTDADRSAAKEKLEQLRREKAEMEARIEQARAAAARAKRQQNVKIEQRCIDNPLAKGCS